MRWARAMTKFPEAITSKCSLIKKTKFGLSDSFSGVSGSSADVLSQLSEKVKKIPVYFLEDNTLLQINTGKVVKRLKKAAVKTARFS